MTEQSELNTSLLPDPTAKQGSTFPRHYPFPIVTERCEPNQEDPNWKIAVGHLKGNWVLVSDTESIARLYMMGFYGKGTLSKNAPAVCTKRTKRKHKKQQKAQKRLKTEDSDDIVIVDSDEDSANVKLEKNDDIDVVLTESSTSESDDEDAENEEKLQLSLQEAYFLSYALGCLIVLEKNQPLNLSNLWIRFCALTPDSNFPIMYTAYHHFRSKGWIVKNGLKFGADFVLYKDGPPFYHATYSVIVKPVKEADLRNARSSKNFTWASLSALNRVNNGAGKNVLILYVIKTSTSEAKEISPECISQYLLEEVLYKRWVPTESREGD